MRTIEELERKIAELENTIQEQSLKQQTLLQRSEKALDIAMHAYKVDHYGFIWVYEWQTKQYVRTQMRVLTPEIAERAVKAKHLADKCIEGRHMVDDLIEGRMIQDNTIKGRSIAPGAVTTDKIGDSEVKSRNIGKGEVKTQNIADDAVTGDKIGDREVKSRNIAERAIDGNHIKDKAIGPEHLQKEIVESRHIMTGAVDITKIKPGTLDGQTVVLNSNMLAVKMKPNGVLVAYYGNMGQIKGVRSDERGHCYLQYEMERA